ncbi:acyl-CoA synthetase [Qipengyuania flava]|uniref:acyl-CoA synthetase n=2 Tax=Qipengyuania flava TaxID=192812 RepID=UPI001C5689F3|nr:acyl-CoA synthetase [Qipengyuania flava]MBW3167070.1 acyl-CoA synthetase [Qipengyuania flava]MBY5964308.1 acyl-CoA synthetase [Qipengyuania flava]MBY6010632.1 acyl-CoA synthetase [Qipengyuania flava]MBY6025074.1 acyl-CoA synthetase [Qipengyuania flava]
MHPITHAQTRPDHPAMIMAGSGETVTFGEMDAYANRFAQLLRARGLERGDHFAVLMENNVHYLQVVWGSQRAGTMMVPISTRLTAPEIAYILKDAGAKFLLTSTHYAEAIAGIRNECPDLPLLIVGGEGDEDYEAALAAQPSEPIADQAPGQYMLYSSGTTGRPKGVKPAPPEDDDILAINPLVGLAVMGAGMPADGSMVYLSPAPLYHAAPIGWCTTAQRLGGTVVVMEKFDPEHALETIEKYKVTDSQWVPTHFVRMLKLDPAVRTRYDLSSHQRALHAAAPCPVPIKREMIEWWGPIINEYYAGSEGIGMTLIKAEDWLTHPGSVGKAIHGTLHVCDAEGEELPAGQDGLLFFENDQIPTYHNDPEKTREAMHPKGWMTLGDIGHVDEDGFLFLTDRKSHMIISGGVNIYPQEIENLLVTHDKVMDAAVIGAPCPDFGEKVVAVVQPMDMAEAGDALEAELRDFLAPSLAKIKMPKLFEFRAQLPREANGKLYKRELRDEFQKAAEQQTEQA